METGIKQITDSKGNTIALEAAFPLYVKANEGSWIASSPDFKTFGYSSVSEDDAIADFDKAIDVFLEVHVKRGTLEKALLAFGWQKKQNTLYPSPAMNRGMAKRKDYKSHQRQLQMA